MAHLWVCMPFLMYWMAVPSAHRGIADPNFAQIQVFLVVIAIYFIVRTFLAFKDPKSLPWEYVFPPIDVAIVSALIWMGNRDPLSNIAMLYFFPIAQAAGTMNTRWVAAVAGMILLGAALATHMMSTDEPFNAAFRYFFIFVLGSLVTMLAKAGASLREQLGIARDRNRMAMEMHDGVQAHLMILSKQLELAKNVAMVNPARASQLVQEGSETARLAADELRYLVNRMRAPSLGPGFLPSLRTFVDTFLTRQGLVYSFEVTGTEKILGRETEHAAFRIAQEALTNAVRHAQATKIDVEVRFTPESVILTIIDNGIGFDPSIESEGLDSMKRRAKGVGGVLNIVPGHPGTRIEADLPLSPVLPKKKGNEEL